MFASIHGRPQRGARGCTCPPLEIQKYGGPHKDNLTRKFFLKLSEEAELRAPHLVSEETDMRGPPIVSKETDLRGPPYSMRTRVGVKYSTCTWYLYLSTYLSVLDVLEYLVYGNAKVLVLVLVLDQKVLGTYK